MSTVLLVVPRLVVLSLSLAIVACSPNTEAAPDASRSTATPSSTSGVSIPDFPTASSILESLGRGMRQPDGSIRTLTSENAVWFSRAIEDPAGFLNVVFLTEAPLDEHGKKMDCHACAVPVTIATFRKVPTGWQALSIQRKLFKAGGWGQVTKPAESRVSVGVNHPPVLLVSSAYSNMGTDVTGVDVLVFSGERWVAGGMIVTGENNRGADCDIDGKSPQSCYEFSATLAVQSSPGGAFPVIIANVKGTKYDDRPNANDTTVVSANEIVRYVFNGHEYAKNSEPAEHPEQIEPSEVAKPAVAVNASSKKPSRSASTAGATSLPNTLDFDQRLADERGTYEALEVQTKICMRDAARAMLRMGNRDKDQISIFQVKACGSPLERYLSSVSKPPSRDQLAGVLQSMADRQLSTVLSAGR